MWEAVGLEENQKVTVLFCWGFCLYLESLVLKCDSLSFCPSFWWTTENILLSESKGWQISSVWGRVDLRRERLGDLSSPCLNCRMVALIHPSSLSWTPVASPPLKRVCFHTFMVLNFWGRPLGSYREDSYSKRRAYKWQGHAQHSKAEKNSMKYVEYLHETSESQVSRAKKLAQHWTHFPVPLTDENQEQWWCESF